MNMTKLDPYWHAYARLQLRSRRRYRMDAIGWGLEAGLDHLLSAPLDDQVRDRDRGAADASERGKARERHRAQLRLRFCDPLEVNDPTAMLDDLARLRAVLSGVNKSDRAILLAVGFGHDSKAIARHHSAKPAAIRQKLTRLRERIAAHV
jgi:hypothetical protein